jgi:N-acetylmuramoyl-L-alanine amidase
MVVLHYTSNDDAAHSLNTLTSAERQQRVSAHYLIERSGKLIQLVPEHKRAWHAGQSYWAGVEDVNSASIGIELDNNGHEPYAAPQIETLLALLQDLRVRYRISSFNFVGHSDVAPGRKIDPGPYFPWAYLAGYGFGYWCPPSVGAGGVETTSDAPGMSQILVLLGYDPRTPEASRQAFRLHYLSDGQGLVTEDPTREAYVAACLASKKTGQASVP